MSKKDLGVVQLEWICPNCHSKNPGLQKTCVSCGSPQPDNVTFQQAESAQVIQDAELVQKAKAGADIHCPYCGARNPAGAASCSQCMGDLKGGKARESGAVIGAYAPKAVKEIACPHCGTKNPETAQTCSSCGGSLAQKISGGTTAGAGKINPVLIGVLIGVVLLICIITGVLLAKGAKKDVVLATLQSEKWERNIAIEAYGPVDKSDFRENIPSDATIGNCELRYHHTQSEPADNSEEVCGTPYSVDEGNGLASVVQDCEYKVSQEYCEYVTQEWRVVDTLTLSGENDTPQWPDPDLTSEQRLGQQSEKYILSFETQKGILEYTTSDESLYDSAQLGTKWDLTVNGFGEIVDIQPK